MSSRYIVSWVNLKGENKTWEVNNKKELDEFVSYLRKKRIKSIIHGTIKDN